MKSNGTSAFTTAAGEQGISYDDLQNLGAMADSAAISIAEWDRLGSLNQGLATTDTVSFAGLTAPITSSSVTITGGTIDATTIGASTPAAVTATSLTTATISSAAALDIDAAGALSLNSSAGAINVGDDAVEQAINIGTGAAARTVTVGNVTGATGLVMQSGTGFTQMTSTGACVVTSTADYTGAVSINSNGGTSATTTIISSGAVPAAIGLTASAGGITLDTSNADGTVTLTTGSGIVSASGAITAGGTVTGGALSDGVATLTGGALSGISTLGATQSITVTRTDASDPFVKLVSSGTANPSLSLYDGTYGGYMIFTDDGNLRLSKVTNTGGFQATVMFSDTEGRAIFRPKTDAVAGFSVQTAASGPVLTADTTNTRLGIGTTAPDMATEINHATGQCLRLTYNDANGSAANYADLTVSSGGDLTIAPSGGDTAITGAATISSTADATSEAAGGALTVSGGLAVAKSAYIGGSLSVLANDIGVQIQQDAGPRAAIVAYDTTGATYRNMVIRASANNSIEIGVDDAVTLAGALDVTGTSTLRAAVSIVGTTPTLTVGDGGAEDAGVKINGSSYDYYMGYMHSSGICHVGAGSAFGDNDILQLVGNTGFVPCRLFRTTTAKNKYQPWTYPCMSMRNRQVGVGELSAFSFDITDSDTAGRAVGAIGVECTSTSTITPTGNMFLGASGSTAIGTTNNGASWSEMLVADPSSGVTIHAGTVPTLTIGDGSAEDTKLVFDGNAQDYYMGLDDTDDALYIGLGSAVGTTPALSVNSSQMVSIHVPSGVSIYESSGYTTTSDASSGIELQVTLAENLDPSGSWAVNTGGGPPGHFTYSGAATRIFMFDMSFSISTSSGGASTLTINLQEDQGTGTWTAVPGAEMDRYLSGTTDTGSASMTCAFSTANSVSFRFLVTSTNAAARYTFNHVSIGATQML